MIIAILAAMLLPALNVARERGKSTSCLANQKQIGIMFMGYTGDYNGFFPHYQSGNAIVDSSVKDSGSDCSNMWHFVLSYLYGRPLKGTTLVKTMYACPAHTPDRLAIKYISYGYNFANIGANAGNDTLELLVPPVKEAGQTALWYKPGMFFSVAETSEVKEECAKFIDWFVNSDEANDIGSLPNFV